MSTSVFVLLFVGVFCIVAIFKVMAIMRRRTIHRYAQERAFRYLADQLPVTLNLASSSFCRAESISSAFAAMGKKKEFCYFDCWIPQGKTGYTQSVLAVLHLEERYPARAFDRELREERVGDWTLIYHDRREWPLNEIDAHVSSI